MFKLTREFDLIWEKAQKANAQLGQNRFHQLYEQNKRFVTVGIYDAVTHKYEMFDSINFAGNYKYDKAKRPEEFATMEKMIAVAERGKPQR